MGVYENNLTPIGKLYNSIKEYVSEEECHTYFKDKFRKYESQSNGLLNSSVWKKSEARILLQVHERVELTISLFERLLNTPSNEEKHQVPSLITYLLLTSFDTLGQRKDWQPFNNWLKSKKRKTKGIESFKNILLPLKTS